MNALWDFLDDRAKPAIIGKAKRKAREATS